MSRASCLLLSLVLALAAPAAAVAQGAVPPPPGKADAVDALSTWRRLQISRAAVKDQIELCDDDARRFAEVSDSLRPGPAADASEWKEWDGLLRDTGRDLESCLRAYVKQIALLRADHKALAEMMPVVQQAKPMSLGPKQLAEVTKAVDDSGGEIDGADSHVAALAETADRSAAEALRLLRQKGIGRVEPLPGFRKLL